MTTKQLLTEAKLDATHWGERIITAEETGRFTKEDREDAEHWQTCACGKQDPRIPRHGIYESPGRLGGEPKDQTLRDLGMKFSYAVERDWPINAARTLIAIEQRAAEILAELPPVES